LTHFDISARSFAVVHNTALSRGDMLGIWIAVLGRSRVANVCCNSRLAEEKYPSIATIS
jgi:hypothetical protein